jgi:hypothetical protein
MTDYEFDMVICVGPKDESIIEQNLQYNKQNIIGYRNIYLVCVNPNIKIDGTITIDEKIFPFKKSDVSNMIGENQPDRHGWYLQQLLKLYAGNIIPGILKRYLVVDADNHFLKPTKFITDDGKHFITENTYENHKEYFITMNKLHPSLNKYHPLSGVSHHCLFHNDRINELLQLVENYHDIAKPFWKILVEIVSETIKNKPEEYSVFSEYETYLNFMIYYHKDEIVTRRLKWENVPFLNLNTDSDFQGVQWYMRR